MKKDIQDRVKQQLNRLPKQWKPRLLQSTAVKEDRLAFLESIKREFRGNLTALEAKSMESVRKQIQKILNPDWLERYIDSIRIHFANNKIPKRFNALRSGQSGQENAQDPVLKKHLKKHGDIIRQLDHDLHRRGMHDSLDSSVLGDILSGQSTIQAQNQIRFGQDTLKHKLTYEKSSETGRYYASESESTLKREVKIDRNMVDNLNIRDLEKRMAGIDWTVNYFEKSVVASNDPEANKRIIDSVGGIFTDLLKIKTSKDIEGAKIHDQLGYKYFSDTPNVQAVGDLKSMQGQYETKVRMNIENASSQAFTPAQMVNLLEGRAVQGNTLNDGENQWFQIDLSKKNDQGYHEVRPIDGSEKIILEAALLKAGVSSIKDPEGDRNPKKMLGQGDRVQASLLQNGVRVDRIITLDIANNSVKVDFAESERRNLIPATNEEGHDKIQQYKSHVENVRDAKRTTLIPPQNIQKQESAPGLRVVRPTPEGNESEKKKTENQKPKKAVQPEKSVQPEMTRQQTFSLWEALQGGAAIQEIKKEVAIKR